MTTPNTNPPVMTSKLEIPRGMHRADDGLLIVDKPAGITSHDVVARMRKMAATKKVGHAGTLDPAATGVLIVGIGKATRLLHYLVGADKAYDAVIRLGASTVSDDADGDYLTSGAIAPQASLSELRPVIEAHMHALRGTIDQVPTKVSAVKIAGQRSYDLVRKGEDVELPARRVTVSRFDITGELRLAQLPQTAGGATVIDIPVSTEVSSGTYIRALARDLGELTGFGGHLTELRRTRVGAFTLSHAHTLTELIAALGPDGSGTLPIMPIDQVCQDIFPRVDLDASAARDLSYGKFITAPTDPLPASAHNTHDGEAPLAAYNRDGQCVALVAERAGQLRPILVFRPA